MTRARREDGETKLRPAARQPGPDRAADGPPTGGGELLPRGPRPGADSCLRGPRRIRRGDACVAGQARPPRVHAPRERQPTSPPTKDNLLVLYIEDGDAIRQMAARMRRHGHESVEPENPYWAEKGLTFEDPDGWRVVLMNTAGI